jgi:hypothetical protein
MSSSFDLTMVSARANFSLMRGWPKALATQAFPKLSMATPRGTRPTLICSALRRSRAGKRVTVSSVLVTQIRSR